MMLYSYLATAILSAATAFAGAWQIQNWRIDAHAKHSIELAAAQERDLHALEQKRSSLIVAAQNAGTARQARLRSDADGARSAYRGLRQSSDAALSFARTDLAACTVAATTYSELFLASTERYSELAEKAGRHVSDIQLMQDGWPK